MTPDKYGEIVSEVLFGGVLWGCALAFLARKHTGRWRGFRFATLWWGSLVPLFAVAVVLMALWMEFPEPAVMAATWTLFLVAAVGTHAATYAFFVPRADGTRLGARTGLRLALLSGVFLALGFAIEESQLAPRRHGRARAAAVEEYEPAPPSNLNSEGMGFAESPPLRDQRGRLPAVPQFDPPDDVKAESGGMYVMAPLAWNQRTPDPGDSLEFIRPNSAARVSVKFTHIPLGTPNDYSPARLTDDQVRQWAKKTRPGALVALDELKRLPPDRLSYWAQFHREGKSVNEFTTLERTGMRLVEVRVTSDARETTWKEDETDANKLLQSAGGF